MPLVLAAALAAAPTLPTCSWDRPGHNPFMGDVVAAVDRYPDIPAATRARLKARMAARQYDEVATIRRDSIDGRARYAPEIRGMHFGQGQVCGTVTRARWTPQMQERGLVYCEDGHCILVPTVCRNVSRIQRLAPPAAAAAVPAAPGGAGGGAATADPAAAMAAALDAAPPGAGLVPPTGAGAALPGSFGEVAGLAVLAPVARGLGDPAGGEPAGPALAGGMAAPGGGEAGPGSAGGGWGEPDAPWLGPIGSGSGGAGGGWVPTGPVARWPDAGGPANPDGPVDSGRLGPTDPMELVPSTGWPGPAAPALPALPLSPVPEPGSAGLLVGGLTTLAGWLGWRRRRPAARPG